MTLSGIRLLLGPSKSHSNGPKNRLLGGGGGEVYFNAPSWEVKQGQISCPLADREVTLTMNSEKHGSVSDFLNYDFFFWYGVGQDGFQINKMELCGLTTNLRGVKRLVNEGN